MYRFSEKRNDLYKVSKRNRKSYNTRKFREIQQETQSAKPTYLKIQRGRVKCRFINNWNELQYTKDSERNENTCVVCTVYYVYLADSQPEIERLRKSVLYVCIIMYNVYTYVLQIYIRDS